MERNGDGEGVVYGDKGGMGEVAWGWGTCGGGGKGAGVGEEVQGQGVVYSRGSGIPSLLTTSWSPSRVPHVACQF